MFILGRFPRGAIATNVGPRVGPAFGYCRGRTGRMTGYERTTFAYTNSEAYEQSLDVYRPTVPAIGAPVVVLIPGSGWLGHRAFLYRLFGLQNALGARSLAAIGCTCVCVRHRGAFIKPPPAKFFALLAAVATWLTSDGWFGFIAMASAFKCVLGVLVLWSLWALLASGAATHDEMLDDVARALAWAHSVEVELAGELRGHRDFISPGEPTRPKRLLGGYSSGGHLVTPHTYARTYAAHAHARTHTHTCTYTRAHTRAHRWASCRLVTSYDWCTR